MENLVSYRKFRPQKFESVLNQEHVKLTLANAVTGGRIGHAYLFTGPRGVGKTTIARIFARAINCPVQANGEPCNECDLCREFLQNSALDLMEIDAASHTGVENIRELIDHLQFAPAKAKYKVIIIDEVHMLSKGAFNALLKTLEEPPAHAVFVLATTEIHKVPQTIVSRTQRFDFRKVSLADMLKLLKHVVKESGSEASDEALLNIAHAADGSFRDSLSLLDQVMSFSQGKITAELAEQVLGLTGLGALSKYLDLLLQGNAREAVAAVSEMVYSGRDLHQFQRDLLEYLRKLLIIKLGGNPDSDYTPEVRQRMRGQAEAVGLPGLMKIINIFQAAGADVKHAAIPSLPLEIASVEAAALAQKSGEAPSSPGAQLVSEPAGEEISPEAESSGQEALQAVAQAWPRIMDKIKEYNHSLISSLKLAVPAAVEGRHLILVFPYKFHKDAIDARKNRIIVDQVLEEVLGMKLAVKPVSAKDWDRPLPQNQPLGQSPGDKPEATEAPPEGLVESALKIMGGEVD